MIYKNIKDTEVEYELVLGEFHGYTSTRDGESFIGDLWFDSKPIRVCSSTVTLESLSYLESIGYEEACKLYDITPGYEGYATYLKEGKQVLKIYANGEAVARFEYVDVIDQFDSRRFICSNGVEVTVDRFGYSVKELEYVMSFRGCSNCRMLSSDNGCLLTGTEVIGDGIDPFNGCGEHLFHDEVDSRETLDREDEPMIESNNTYSIDLEWDDDEFPF